MQWIPFIPELALFAIAGVFFILSMFKGRDPRNIQRIAFGLTAIGLLVSVASVRCEGTLFFRVYRIDLFSQIFKLMLAGGLFLTVCLCSGLKGIREDRHAEFYLLLTTCTLGTMLLVSSVELVTLYLSLELTSYSLYVLVPLRKGDGIHMEAGIKYFLLGTATSAVTLFGIALLFGATRSTYLTEIVRVLPGLMDTPMAFIGLLFALCGFFFKLSLFPFHIWAPNVYQGSANQVTAYIATTTKVAAIAVIMRMVALSAGSGIRLIHVLAAIAISSMTLGNLAAIVQRDMKRLLAYSAIAQGGYALIGILSMSESGYAGAIFYALAYLVMSFTCFLVLVQVAFDGSNLRIEQLAGLHRRSPLLAMALMLGVFSLGGLPPTIGFTGKFLIFTAAMEKGYFYLVFIAMINVAISLYYYALIVKAAYLPESEEKLAPITLSLPKKLLIGITVLFLVGGGVFPNYLYTLARSAARLLM